MSIFTFWTQEIEFEFVLSFYLLILSDLPIGPQQ